MPKTGQFGFTSRGRLPVYGYRAAIETQASSGDRPAKSFPGRRADSQNTIDCNKRAHRLHSGPVARETFAGRKGCSTVKQAIGESGSKMLDGRPGDADRAEGAEDSGQFFGQRER